jgi:diguanylate cyclase (GGDEF)-like protein
MQQLLSWYSIAGHGPLIPPESCPSEGARASADRTIETNRRKITRALQAASRKRTPLGVVFFDMDGFRRKNDLFGVSIVNRALDKLLDSILIIIAEKGKLYHYFGDEFVILVPNANLSEAAATAERIRQAIESSSVSAKLNFTASFGVAVMLTATSNAEAVLKEARDAAFASKIKGKNLVTTSPLSNTERALLESVWASERSAS